MKTNILIFLLLIFEFRRINSQNLIKLWQDFPLKLLLNTTVLQPKCQKAYINFLNSLENNDLNALKMLDATAKLPSGLLNGNIIQFGSFDQCLEIPNAQYCLAELNLERIWKEPFTQFKNYIHSFYFIRNKLSDPFHRIPGFSLFHWGFCLPKECSSLDLQKSLEANLGVEAQIQPGMCQKIDEIDWSLGDSLVRFIFGLLLLAVALSTLIDYFDFFQENNPNNDKFMECLMSFSLKKNIGKFLEIKSDKNEIRGLHGIRALNALALLLSHKAISLFFYPFLNRTTTILNLTKPWTIIAKNAIVYTDSFMLLSGLLNANSLLTDLNNGRGLKFKDKLINRLFRILPNLITLILFCTYILPKMGSGPLWPIVINHHSMLCKKFMWRNFFLIHNYFGFEKMCLTHTHQLGIDMQLFLVTPPIVYLLWKNRRLGFLVLATLSLISTFLRIWVAYHYELSNIVYFGIPISKMFATSTLSYILPTHRATIYFIGVFLAYFLKFYQQEKPSFLKSLSLWCFFLSLFLWSWIGQYHMVGTDYIYNKFDGMLIAGCTSILWGAGISFGIYACKHDIAGLFGDILCWKYFQIVAKISYALYLVQFPVFFYNIGLVKHVDEYQPHYLVSSKVEFTSIRPLPSVWSEWGLKSGKFKIVQLGGIYNIRLSSSSLSLWSCPPSGTCSQSRVRQKWY